MSNECFSNQFHYPKSRSRTVFSRTHKIPKGLKTKLHNRWAFSQWSNKSTVTPQIWHIMHQSTKSKLLSPKLSPIRILFQVTVQTKNETHQGALSCWQWMFQRHHSFKAWKAIPLCILWLFGESVMVVLLMVLSVQFMLSSNPC